MRADFLLVRCSNRKVRRTLFLTATRGQVRHTERSPTSRNGGRPIARQRGTPYHLGLTPEQIVDEALALTEESHLLGWSLRDLAQRCDVTVSVVTHHVGTKDHLLHRVVETALSELEPPPDDVAWEDWFRTMLHAIRPPLRRYPGTAKWVLLYGPSFPSILPMIDAGIAALQRAGFGDKTGLAFATLLNNAVMTVAIADERLLDGDGGTPDHDLMMRNLRETGRESPGVAVLDTTLMAPFALDAATAEQARDGYYGFVIEVTIAGLTALVEAGESSLIECSSRPHRATPDSSSSDQ